MEKWEPDYCGELDIEIRRDGTWTYMGTPIGRQSLVRLFSTVLRKDADGLTYLVTPVEKILIKVVDAPFTVVELDVDGEGEAQLLHMRTNVGDVVRVGAEHPLSFAIEPQSGGVKPYVHVRGRLEALLNRSVMYELMHHGEVLDHEGQESFCIRSDGQVFPVMPADELARLSQ